MTGCTLPAPLGVRDLPPANKYVYRSYMIVGVLSFGGWRSNIPVLSKGLAICFGNSAHTTTKQIGRSSGQERGSVDVDFEPFGVEFWVQALGTIPASWKVQSMPGSCKAPRLILTTCPRQLSTTTMVVNTVFVLGFFFDFYYSRSPRS